MTDPDVIGLFIEPLETVGVSYMITGGVASVIYGDPRFTRDVDIVMELRASEIAALDRRPGRRTGGAPEQLSPGQPADTHPPRLTRSLP